MEFHLRSWHSIVTLLCYLVNKPLSVHGSKEIEHANHKGHEHILLEKIHPSLYHWVLELLCEKEKNRERTGYDTGVQNGSFPAMIGLILDAQLATDTFSWVFFHITIIISLVIYTQNNHNAHCALFCANLQLKGTVFLYKKQHKEYKTTLND